MSNLQAISEMQLIVIVLSSRTIRDLKAGFSIILAYIRLPRMINHSNKEEISSEMFSVANTTCAAYLSHRLNMTCGEKSRIIHI